MKTNKSLSFIAAACVFSMASASDLGYLQGLLGATPEGSWVMASANRFADAWPTGLDLPPPTPSGPAAIAYAWSGFAWDSTRGNLMLFGGGHANYVGNEVYLWQGSNGMWARGTLPSFVNLATGLVSGNGAPQASHTFQTNSYAPVNDRFVVFGGAAWNSGANLAGPGGRTGPWWWDPANADPNKVGGADGTGWDVSRTGANSWQARPFDPWVGLPSQSMPNYLYGSTAYRNEGGKDVIYVTMESNASGFPRLMRYELGDEVAPDTWQTVGLTYNSVMASGAAAIDSSRGLFMRNAVPGSGFTSDLAIFDLSKNNPQHPERNVDFGVRLVDEGGAAVDLSFAVSLAYDTANDQLVMWDGLDRGTVWVTRPEYLSSGAMDPVWTVHKVTSTTAAQPVGNHGDGVLGKWKYVDELGAFVAMDAYSSATQDSAIWLYKPITAVPEPETWALMAGGLLLMAAKIGRRFGRGE